jgi:hypothetical protein
MEMRWAGYVGGNVHRTGCTHRFGRLKRKLDDTIKMNLKKTQCENGRWRELGSDCVLWWAFGEEVLKCQVLLLHY